MIALLSLAFAGTFDAFDKASGNEARLDALFAVIDDEGASEDHGEAWSRMGGLFADAELEGAALVAYGHAFEKGATGSAVKAFALADQVGDHAIVAGPLADYEPEDAKPLPGEKDERSHVAYLVARDLLRRDRLGPTLDWLKRVDGDSPDFADAESVRGVVLAAQGKNEEALVPLQTARALGVSLDKGERFDTKILMNLARAYYGARNWGQSIYHYKQVPRDSDFWVEAHFEEAWAHFMGADMSGALGLLHSFSSPFMDGLWYPEADMLRVQGLFMMCKFGTAVEEMDAFEKHYQPVLEQLDGALTGLDEAGTFADVGSYLDKGIPKLPPLVIRRYRSEDRIAEARTAVDHYRTEADGLEALGKHGTKVAGWLNGRADTIAKREGGRILTRIKGERDELHRMLTDLELARVDILQLESRLYERAAATGTLEDLTADRIGKLRELRKKKGYQVWPFEGEYWADELGWYQVDSRSDCPESLARKIGG
ncbi:MAG: hypothetical protein H6737_27290 [Alphaproteobacteria bacterium]|nr:hypothetical protein [Alphaproteobacteria bacterium]